MGLLDKLGFGQRKPRPVGNTLETGRPPGPDRRRNGLVKAGIITALIVGTVAAFPRGLVYENLAQVGDTWRYETLEAPSLIPLRKTEAEYQADLREARAKTIPSFRRVEDLDERMRAKRDTLETQVNLILESYADYLHNRSRGRLPEAARDSARYEALRADARVRLSDDQWEALIDSFAQTQVGLTQRSRLPEVVGPPLHSRLIDLAYDQSQAVHAGREILDVPRDSIRTETIQIRYYDRNAYEDLDVEDVRPFGLDDAYEAARRALRREYPDSEEAQAIGFAFFRTVFTPSLVFLRSETMRELRETLESVPRYKNAIREGEVIVERGERVTPEVMQKLRSLDLELNKSGTPHLYGRTMLGQVLLTLATYLLFFLYLYLLRPQVYRNNGMVLLVALLFGLIIGLFAVAIRIPGGYMLAVPVAIVAVLMTVIFDSRVGLFATLTLALLGGQMLSFNYEYTFATILAAGIGVFSVRDIKNRGQFVLSAGLVFLGYVVILTAVWLVSGSAGERLQSEMLMVGANATLLLLAYPLLWIFERVFDITTDLTLLELSDTNRPLLKELSLRAPGTFNHSLQVANLAEAAADAVGAHALLTRVGALYHDIGKMLKPEYFVENQRPGDNPHDQVKPRMSALIIASHVKEGLEMGRQYKLPQRVLSFIPMHHGTTRIEYFYRKAIEHRTPDEPPVQESAFRYPGPRPNSKETGILMLADSVEAASRSLSEPTHKRLETLIEMIFKARIEDGQLDNTDLTFRDLDRIRETFLSLLMGIYHVRVKYPGQKGGRPDGTSGEEGAEEGEPGEGSPAAEGPRGETSAPSADEPDRPQPAADRAAATDPLEEELDLDPARRADQGRADQEHADREPDPELPAGNGASALKKEVDERRTDR